jgi:hypothetical protein
LASGSDERQQLKSVAALLAANPKLKPTSAIRSLGVRDPATIRRLNSRFRIQQSSLMADARRVALTQHSRVSRASAGASESVHRAHHDDVLPCRRTAVTDAGTQSSPAAALIGGWCDLGFSALAAAGEVQSSFMQFWLAMPAVGAATRGQLVLGSVAIAMHKRCRTRPF